jgi:hypothetical protein
MATRRPAKIASKKSGRQKVKHCPECENEMQIAQLIRVSGPSGMFWLCENRSCNTLLTTANAPAGKLQLK